MQDLETLHPNKENDWINLRNPVFSTFIPLGNKRGKSKETFFEPMYSLGIATNRDAWGI